MSKLTKEQKDIILPHIMSVLDNGVSWEDQSLHFPVDDLVGAILEIEGVTRSVLSDPEYGIDGFETNGWQWDWWQTFEFQGAKYTLRGSGYYGGHSFYLKDDV